MDALTEFLSADLDEELTVAGFENQSEPRLLTPEEEIEHAIDKHRRALDLLVVRVAETRTAEKAALREQEDERRRIEQRYRADMARIDDEIAAIRATAAKTVDCATKMAGSARQALEALLA